MIPKRIRNAGCAILTLGFLAGVGGCREFNNPFNPRSEVTVLDVVPGKIEQSFNGNMVIYQVTDPQAKLEVKAPLPRVIYKEMAATLSLSGVNFEIPKSKIFITLPSGANGAIKIPLLSRDSEMITNAVFPSNTIYRASSASALVTMTGEDDNGNEILTTFSVPLEFNSKLPASGTTPLPFATPSASPSPQTPAPASSPAAAQ